MAVRLQVKQRSEAGGADKSTEVVLQDDTITLGRDKACHVVLAQQAVSRSHARISRDGQLFFIEDLGSAYGTHVNGQPLPRGEKRLLRNGDTIAIAAFDVTFERISDAVRASNADKTSFVARMAVKDLLRGGQSDVPSFRIMNGPREGQRIEVPDAHELVVGRDDDVDVVFKDDLVSRRHAKIRRDWSGTHVEDLGSRNGIKVNKKRATRRTLKDGDEVEIGGIRLLFIDPSAVPDAPLSLHAPGESTNHEPDDAEPLPNGTAPPSQAKAEAAAAAAKAKAEAEAAEAEAAAAAAAQAPPEPASGESGSPETREQHEPDEGAPGEDEDLEANEAMGDEEGLEEEEPEPELPPEPEGPPLSLMERLRRPGSALPLVALGVFALLALGLIIAVFVGA